MKKYKSKTISRYNKWKTAKYSLYASTYIFPLVPAAAIRGIHWNEWFNKSGPSLPFGFATLLASVLITIWGIAKRDDLLKKNVSPLFYMAAVMAIWAVAFMFLANICNQIGQMLMWTVVGILSGASADQVNKSIVFSRIEEYKKIIDENGLDEKARRKKERKEKLEEEAKKEAEMMQAVE